MCTTYNTQSMCIHHGTIVIQCDTGEKIYEQIQRELWLKNLLIEGISKIASNVFNKSNRSE